MRWSWIYLLVRRSLELAGLRLLGKTAKDVELLVLRHQLAVLQRQVGRPKLGPGDRVGAGNCVTLCDLRVLVDEAAESVTSVDEVFVAVSGWFGVDELVRSTLLEGSVWSMGVVMVCVLVDDESEVPRSGDQDAVGGFASA